MTDADLKKHLAALSVPVAADADRERALHRATVALTAFPRPPGRPHVTAPRWRLAFLALPVLLLSFGWWLLPSPASLSATDCRQLLVQLNQLFPGQLNAVVEFDGGVKIDLSDATTAPSAADQSIVIELRRKGHLVRIIAYSGRPVDIAVAGLSLRIDPLLTAKGGVLLASDRFVWDSAQPAVDPLQGWQIAAHPLVASL